MRLLFCGVRGSTPAPGAEFVRYGGNTSCVAISGDGDSAPRLVLDAGTGLRRLASVLGDRPFRGTILLGHMHWDHTQGLPFFSAGDRPDSRVDVVMPAQQGPERPDGAGDPGPERPDGAGDPGPERSDGAGGATDPEELLARMMSPPHFPIRPSQLVGDWSFVPLQAGQHELEGFSVLALDIPHKGGRTFGFRISDGNGSLAYLSDHSPLGLGDGPDGLGEYHEAAMALCRGVDVLIHDAQHTAEELPHKAGFGHSAAEYAVGLAGKAGVRRLLLYHHDPPRTDDQIDAMVGGLGDGPVEVAAAAEGMTVDV